MSYPGREDRDFAEGLLQLLNNVARVVFWIGALGTLIGIGFLVFTATAVDSNTNIEQAEKNVNLFGNILLGGSAALAIGSTVLFWGEEVLAGIQLVIGGLLFFSPLFLPSIGVDASRPSAQHAMTALRNGGLLVGVIGILVLVIDLTGKAKMRMQQGSKADQMKYGKGIREERDRQNVFMGKCWQLPFCRKFVRDKCPIYHAKRTCWRELVGCMCEEQVIRDAMENKPIPKDELLAAKMIPHNHKLTLMQKRERCKSCVIYNEHQKHKYRLALPVVLVTFALLYMVARAPLNAATAGLIGGIDRMIGQATFNKAGGQTVVNGSGGQWFTEVLTVCIILVLFTYVMKLLEYLIFKLKV